MYFEERFNEKKEDPLKGKITFTYPWILTRPQLDGDNVIHFAPQTFITKYKFLSTQWLLFLKRNRLTIFNTSRVDGHGELIRVWNGKCFCSYNLYSDTEGRLLLYSSPRTKMRNCPTFDCFDSPTGFLTNFDEALNGQLVKTMVVFVELVLPTKFFYRPFELPTCALSKHLCEKYPTDMDNDFRFDFMKDSDFVIKCPDGSMPAMKIILNNASEFMHEHFNSFPNGNELAVYHSIDVIKPIITCFHTRCFEMPKVYDLDYAKRLLDARVFLILDIKRSIHQSLCQKFVEEKHTFDSILQWLKIAYEHYFFELQKMVTIVICDKFYYEWQQTFPENARIEENPIFRDVFDHRSNRAFLIFSQIEYNMRYSLITNVILD